MTALNGGRLTAAKGHAVKITIDIDPKEIDRLEALLAVRDRSDEENHEIDLIRAVISGKLRAGFFIANLESGAEQ